ncbi:uncharacterized protein BO72DRAFT_501379 [Aspergillus fijiensis CBS 313.89]|uniref:Sensor histidine kinase/response regulator n=1 Tax=Aspergillus fijiensis CBS 313.89 TaxID=1448319 RepID=A0A8G1RH15_9EURO|nr:uncharacterized protein BO72DRAFT_501379 [Aspergillus fijiensis CBS 313.89]RAK72008.1 hypothetical protein BO72DRAFT_501379 [Aspergillus fijiensis CBS 313.89]
MPETSPEADAHPDHQPPETAANSSSTDLCLSGPGRVYPLRSIIAPTHPLALPYRSSSTSSSSPHAHSLCNEKPELEDRDEPLEQPPVSQPSTPPEQRFLSCDSPKQQLQHQQSPPYYHHHQQQQQQQQIDGTGSITPTKLFDHASGSEGLDHLNLENLGSLTPSSSHRRYDPQDSDEDSLATTSTTKTLQACEDEPIHRPGAVQCFGALVVLEQVDEGTFMVQLASENSEAIIGHSPQNLFTLNSFSDLLRNDQDGILRDHVQLTEDDQWSPAVDGPEIFKLSINDRHGHPQRFWSAVHRNPAHWHLIICEFESEIDRLNPVNTAGQTLPAKPTDILGFEPTADQIASSTVKISQPLRLLRNRRRKPGEMASMEVLNIISKVQDQLGRTQDPDTLLNVSIGLIKELTGYHRVMIYQFDHENNGNVVAELADPRFSKDIFKGLSFPAADIPQQARDLYKKSKVRLLYNRDHINSPLVSRDLEHAQAPLDMTYAFLRAMSPYHLKYLARMCVRSSMSISINDHEDLWGLIICHSYGEHGMRVPFPVIRLTRLIGDSVYQNIKRLSCMSHLEAGSPANQAAASEILKQDSHTSEALLKLFDADFAALSIRGRTSILGESTDFQEILAVVEYFRSKKLDSVVASNYVIRDFPDLHFPPGIHAVSGVMYAPLSLHKENFIVFFRRTQMKDIRWGGNPYAKPPMQPRKDFRVWRETVVDRSREWTTSQTDNAAVLGMVGSQVSSDWRTETESPSSSSQHAKSGDEIRNTLNTIMKNLGVVLGGSFDSEFQDSITRSYSASKSLLYVINDLLDLTKDEEGYNLIKDEAFEISSCFHEATKMFEAEARRKGLFYKVIHEPGIPKGVLGDERRVRQVISNLISNAIQHTSEGGITVEMWRDTVTPAPGRAIINITVVDTGCGMSSDKLDMLFCELEEISMERKNGGTTEESSTALEQPHKKHVLGMGLALVSRIVRNCYGQLVVHSEEGKGSRFAISLQFDTG